MEPRELWERHAVLAQAFCSSDDEVRRTQGLLDEAEARRSRTLAAFAVTVGSDAVVAELLGLDEREVRLARRTVGKEDARAVAKSLLAQTTREQPPAQQTATPPATPLATPSTAQSTTPPAAQPAGPATVPPAAAPNVSQAPQPHEPAWAPALDAVLMSSWHSGVDLTALATELGLDVRLLVARAQQLAAESRPVQSPPPDRMGRHRRLAHLPPAQQHESTASTWRERPPHAPREPYEQEPWKQQPYQNYRDQQEYQDYQEHRVYEEHPQQHPQHVQQHPQHMPNHQHQQQLQQNQHHSPHQQYQQASPPTWDANAITAAQHDWDGILSQWEATTSPTPPLSAPGQGGV
ncbi:hypothetical protein RM550_19470 [Streptomyces sp. DSM 41527]|uniref:Uncharacterized protein n=1 Tax=Streptomyces mooreae TaxID=3075523 RepID=A0ABU2TAD7_9ACTN|nr:hypothetical protein [Streptomyces sp. DSM 41527]MDT0457889.1 hypothetical protein [Streptomyces sp. DSM 41527]